VGEAGGPADPVPGPAPHHGELLIMSGANLPAVQRILRHSDREITTEV
jgi:hypothetical protein